MKQNYLYSSFLPGNFTRLKRSKLPLTICFFAILTSLPIFSFSQDSASAFYKSGMENFSSGLYNAASKDFDKAIQLNPAYAEAYIANGKVNMEMNRIYEANTNFSKAHELQPKNKEVTRELMLIQFNSNKNEQAIQLAGQCGCDEAARVMGISYYRLEDYGNAQIWLQKALKQNDKDGEVSYTLGRTFLELEKDNDAITYYEKAVKDEPTRNNWQYELGLLYYNANRFADAAKTFQDAANAGYRQTNDFLENLGFCQLYGGDITNGMKNLNTVLEHKPGNVTLLTNIAYAMYSTKRYEGAVEFYQKVLNLNPTDANSLYMAGMAFQKMGQKDKGQAICDKAIEMDPSLAKYRQKKELPTGL